MVHLMLVVMVLCVGITSATIGFDTISPLSASAFSCLSDNGYSFFIGRVSESDGRIDLEGIRNMQNARAGGALCLDFPKSTRICHVVGCSSADRQFNSIINTLRKGDTQFGKLWLDVKIQNWSKNLEANQKFILDVVKQCDEMGVKVGINSTKWDWDNIVGESWNGVAALPLWWDNHSGEAGNFNYFVPFGGWKKPTVHQYLGNINGACSVGNVNLNWQQ